MGPPVKPANVLAVCLHLTVSRQILTYAEPLENSCQDNCRNPIKHILKIEAVKRHLSKNVVSSLCFYLYGLIHICVSHHRKLTPGTPCVSTCRDQGLN